MQCCELVEKKTEGSMSRGHIWKGSKETCKKEKQTKMKELTRRHPMGVLDTKNHGGEGAWKLQPAADGGARCG